MALVIRRPRPSSPGLKYEMAAQCSNYQQLQLMKARHNNSPAHGGHMRRHDEEREAGCESLPPTSLPWNWRGSVAPSPATSAGGSAGRGVRAVEETVEERMARPATRHEALLWYRNGGREELEEDSARLSNCGNYKQ